MAENYVQGQMPAAPVPVTGFFDAMMRTREQNRRDQAEALRLMMLQNKDAVDSAREAERLRHDQATEAYRQSREGRLDRLNETQADRARRAEIGNQLPSIMASAEQPDMVAARLSQLDVPFEQTTSRGPAPVVPAQQPVGPTQAIEGPIPNPDDQQQAGLIQGAAAVPGDAPPEAGAAADTAAIGAQQADAARMAESQDPAVVARNVQTGERQASEMRGYQAQQAAYEAQRPTTTTTATLPGGRPLVIDPNRIRQQRETQWKTNADNWLKNNTYQSPGEVAGYMNQYAQILHGEIAQGMDTKVASEQLNKFIAAKDKAAELAALTGNRQAFTEKEDHYKAGEAFKRALLGVGWHREHDRNTQPERDDKLDLEREKLRNSTSGQFRMEEAGLAKRFHVKDIGEEVDTIADLNRAVNSNSSADASIAIGNWVKTAQGKGDRISDADINTFYGRIGGVAKYAKDPLGAATAAAEGRLSPEQQKQMLLVGQKMLHAKLQHMKRYIQAGDTALGERYPDDWARYRQSFEDTGLAPPRVASKPGGKQPKAAPTAAPGVPPALARPEGADQDSPKERQRRAARAAGTPEAAQMFQRVYGEPP